MVRGRKTTSRAQRGNPTMPTLVVPVGLPRRYAPWDVFCRLLNSPSTCPLARFQLSAAPGPRTGVQALHHAVDDLAQAFLELVLVEDVAVGDRFAEAERRAD